MSQPHDAYEETPLKDRLAVGCETRLESGQIKSGLILHASIEFAPLKLKDPENMITLENLQSSFGSQWKPKYAEMNDFEKYCRDHWGVPPVSLDTAGLSRSLNASTGTRR